MGRVQRATSRPGRGTGTASTDAPTYDGATSGYGLTRADSVGYNPRNPYAYMATQAAKAYTTSDTSDVKKK